MTHTSNLSLHLSLCCQTNVIIIIYFKILSAIALLRKSYTIPLRRTVPCRGSENLFITAINCCSDQISSSRLQGTLGKCTVRETSRNLTSAMSSREYISFASIIQVACLPVKDLAISLEWRRKAIFSREAAIRPIATREQNSLEQKPNYDTDHQLRMRESTLRLCKRLHACTITLLIIRTRRSYNYENKSLHMKVITKCCANKCKPRKRFWRTNKL